jgi:hypothetical protein
MGVSMMPVSRRYKKLAIKRLGQFIKATAVSIKD